MSLQKQEETNIVHGDENWRQRIVSEENAAASWRGSWGFLQPKETARAVDTSMNKDELDRIVSHIGPCYDFLDKKQTREQAQLAAANEMRANRRRGMGQMIMEQDQGRTGSPGSQRGSRPSSSRSQKQGAAPSSRGSAGRRAVAKPGSRASKEPKNSQLLFLDAQTALSLQPQTLQGVGASIVTPGVDPRIKYQHPLTSQHVHGWAPNSLEFFGVAQHGRQANIHKAQFDEV